MDEMKLLYERVKDRRDHPKEGSHTTYLFEKGIDKILKKFGEECVEIVIASKNGSKEEFALETADMLYNLNVLMVELGVEWDAVYDELKKRRG